MMDVFYADERMRNLFIRSFVGCVAWELKEFESSTIERKKKKTTYLKSIIARSKSKVDDALLIM